MTFTPIILSYHRFTETFDDYPFSRTYEQFHHDIRKKVFDILTIDDAHHSIVKACDMMREINVRAKLFIPTALVGTEGYCTWDELRELSRFHDLESHGHEHVRLDQLTYEEIKENISLSIDLIERNICQHPRFFCPPWNAYNDDVKKVCKELKLIPVYGRIDIKNTSR